MGAARSRSARITAGIGGLLGLLLVVSGVTAPRAEATWAQFTEESPVALMGGSGKPTDAGAFVPVTPARFLDTRAGNPVSPDTAVSFQVAGRSGIPANAAAVVFNLTVTEPASFGFVTAYGSGTARPNSSNVNFNNGQTIPNAVTVPVGADGKVSLFNRSSGTTHLIADVSGYYLSGNPTVAGAFVPVAPARFLDTRGGSPVGPDAPVSFQVGGRNGIPANAAAVVFNLTVTEPGSAGFATAYGSGTARPNSSNVNFNAGQTIPNSVTVPVGADGKVSLFNRSSGNTHMIADVSGYYLAGNPTVPGAFVPVIPARFLDTRASSPVGPDTPISFQVSGRNGIPAVAAAVVFNLTVTDPASFGFATAYGSGTARPGSSNVNFNTNQTIPNSVTVPVGADGKVSLFNRSSGNTHMIADVAGYYLPGAPNSVATWGDNGYGLLGNGLTPYFTSPQPVAGLSTIKQWSFSGSTRLALRTDGTVYTWGNSWLTNGTTDSTGTPKQVAGLSNVASVTAGGQSFYAVLADGSVRSWGSNYNGELGNGTTTQSSTPVQVTGLAGVAQLVTSGASAYALLTNGTVKAWGYNYGGQLGNGTNTSSSIPVDVPGLANVTAIATQGATVFAVLSDGSVRAWGDNSNGQFGDGTTTSSTVPVTISGLTEVTSISSNQTSYYALTTDKTVFSWGQNYYGQLGDGTTTDRKVPARISSLAAVTKVVTTDSRAFAVLADGTVRGWGENAGGQLGNGTKSHSAVPAQVTGLSQVKDLTANYNLTFAVRSDNTVLAWGDNSVGSLGNGTTTSSSTPVRVTGLSGVTAVATFGWSTMAMMVDGTIRGWGDNYTGELGIEGTTSFTTVPAVVPALAGAVSVTTQGSTRYAVMNDGSVRAWGNNSSGQFGNGTTANSSTPVPVQGLAGVRSIVSNGWASYALLADGTVRAWGRNHLGQLGNGSYIDSPVPVQVSGLTEIESIYTIASSAYALRRDGTVWGWGENGSGQLGNTSAGSIVIAPVQATGLSGVKQLLVGSGQAFALLADGTVRAWGANSSGQLGTGNTTGSRTPVQVPGLAGVKELVNAGPLNHSQGSNTFAVLNDGTVRAWGSAGMLGNGTDAGSSVPVQVSELSDVSSVAVGDSSAYALRTNGTVWAWGRNEVGQLGNGGNGGSNVPVPVQNMTGVASVTAASNAGYALKTDGTVWSWGGNQEGQLGNGTTNSSSIPAKMTGLAGVTRLLR